MTGAYKNEKQWMVNCCLFFSWANPRLFLLILVVFNSILA